MRTWGSNMKIREKEIVVHVYHSANTIYLEIIQNLNDKIFIELGV